MDTKKAQELLDKHRSGTITPEEKALLDSWYVELSRIQPPADLPADLIARQKADFARINTAIQPRPIRLWPRIAAAASVLVLLGTGSYFILHKPKATPATEQTAAYHNDVPPGHHQATLTLANGQKIILTKTLSGQIATQGQTQISATDNQLVYQSNQNQQQISYNSVATAKGEASPFPLVLADGTKVWLNAESKLTFPTAFPGKERIVKLTGEAYFEVKHNAEQPFKVQTEKQTIEDIGTSFNVNAYGDEGATRTTLVEGSVKVNNLTLKPGQQTDGQQIKSVNTSQFTAWKDGDFNFENNDIKTVMRQLSRWYDIEVAYEGPVSNDGFNALISREKNISAILHGLEKTKGVHFKIEGRRVIVSR